jgi:CRP-like cAMP-binding protein
MRRTVAANAEIFAEGDRATTFRKVVSGIARTDKLLSDGRRQNFGWATDHLLALAERVCGGRLVSVLKGGYDFGGLSRGVQVHVAALLEAGSVRTRGLSEDAPDLSDP